MLFLMLSLACGEVWELEQRTDDGTACLDAPTADAQGTVHVYADTCLSSSCDRNAQGSCTATLDGDTITVSSSFSWETAVSGVDCTDDCGLLDADCTVGPLAAGGYTLVHGEQQELVTVPTEGDCQPW